MTILKILVGILKLAEWVASYADRRQLMEAGEAKSMAVSLKHHQKKISTALAAMHRADKLPPEDRYRPDE